MALEGRFSSVNRVLSPTPGYRTPISKCRFAGLWKDSLRGTADLWCNMSDVYETDHNMLGVEISWGCGGGMDLWAHQDSNLGPSDYESDALTN